MFTSAIRSGVLTWAFSLPFICQGLELLPLPGATKLILATPEMNGVDAGGGEKKAKTVVPADATLDFKNGTRLRGILEESKDGGLSLKHPAAVAPLNFRLDELLGIRLKNAALEPAAEAAAKPCHATVKFLNGDWLRAEVPFIRDGRVTLRLSNGQVILADQAAVESIYFSPTSGPDLLTGSTRARDWQGTWKEKDGKITTREMVTLSRRFQHLPERVELRFSMPPSEAQRNFMFNLNFSGTGEQNINAWSQIRFNEAMLYVNLANGGKSSNQSKELPSRFTRKGADGDMHYRVFYDRTEAGRVWVYLNNQLVDTRDGLLMPEGACHAEFTIQPMRWSSSNQWTIYGIGLEAWDGVLPDKPDQAAPAGQHLVSQAGNEPPVVGKVIELKGALLQVETAKGLQEVPRSEVRLIRLNPRSDAPALPAGGSLIGLTTGGKLSVRGFTLTEGNATLHCASLPEISLSKSALSEILLPAAFVEAEADAALPSMDMLIFRNGDQLLGKVEGVAEDTLQWKYGTGEGQLTGLKGPWLASVRLAETPPDGAAQEPAKLGEMGLRLKSGDWVTGTLQTIAEDKLQFLGPLGKTLGVPTAEVRTLFFGKDGAPAVSEGADSPDIWWKGTTAPASNLYFGSRRVRDGNQGHSQQTVCVDGSFLLSGPKDSPLSRIGRVLDSMPDRVDLNFTLRCREQTPCLGMQLFFDANGNAGLHAQLWNAGVYLYDLSSRNARRRGGHSPVQATFEPSKIKTDTLTRKIRILADRKLRRLVLFVDGHMVINHASRMEDENESWGNALQLYTDNNVETMLSDLWVGPWNGVIPGKADLPFANARVLLTNGDELATTVLGDDGKLLKVDFEGDKLDIPHQRLVLVDFADAAPTAGAPKEAQKINEPNLVALLQSKNTTKVRLKRGGSVTLQSFACEAGKITGELNGVGSVDLPLTSCREIIWGRLEFEK